MGNKFEDAFQRGQKEASIRDANLSDAIADTISKNKELWRLLVGCRAMLKQAGVSLADKEGDTRLFGRISDLGTGSCSIYWYPQMARYWGHARGATGETICDFGGTPDEACANILYYAGSRSLVFSNDY